MRLSGSSFFETPWWIPISSCDITKAKSRLSGLQTTHGKSGKLKKFHWLIFMLCIKRDAPCQLQINRHFHFLNFPTVSSLLHISKILVHWIFLEISGLKKWVVGATLALKQKFLAATLNLCGRKLSKQPYPNVFLFSLKNKEQCKIGQNKPLKSLFS